MAAPDVHCANPLIIRAGVRHAPQAHIYDEPWWENFTKAGYDTMCSMGLCGVLDVNAWVEAADTYAKRLQKQIERVDKGLRARQDGKLTFDQTEILEAAQSTIDDWEEAFGDFEPYNALENAVTLVSTVKDEIDKVVTLWERMTCAMDDVNALQGEGGYIEKPPAKTVGPPEGHDSYFDPEAGKEKPGAGALGGMGTAIGVVGLGIAGFFAYKLLTE